MQEFRRVAAVTNLETLVEIHDGHGQNLGYEVVYPDGRTVTYAEHIAGARPLSAIEQAEVNLKLRTNERDQAYEFLDRFGERLDQHEQLLNDHYSQLQEASKQIGRVTSWMDGFKRHTPNVIAIGCSVGAAALVLTHAIH